MTIYIAFLRGINVGGNVLVPMKDLVTVAQGVGFKNVRTYINSGNVIFESSEGEDAVRAKFETALEKKWKRKIAVMIRTDKELKSIVAKNPFPKAEPSKVAVVLLNNAVPKEYLKDFSWDGPEEDGKRSGMISVIEENRPYEFISIKHIGIIDHDVEDTTSDKVKAWTPAHENYTVLEKEGATELVVEVDSAEEYKEMFEEAWPKALAKLREICEK